MKRNTPFSFENRRRRIFFSGALLVVLLLTLQADPPPTIPDPTWWPHYKVLKTGAAPLDYSAVNQGQLKNIVLGAYQHLLFDAIPAGGLGDMTANTGRGWKLRELVKQWVILDPTNNAPLRQVLDSGGNPVLDTDNHPIYRYYGTGNYQLTDAALTHNDYRAVNLGTLKAVATPFYDRLEEIYATVNGFHPPWHGSTNAPLDFATANLGQLKNVFSFDLRRDSDNDGVDDVDELALGLNPSALDGDGDGVPDAAERHHTDPTRKDRPEVGLSVTGYVVP